MNILKQNEETYVICCLPDELFSCEILFAKCKYSLFEILKEYKGELCKSEVIQILPGVFLHDVNKYALLHSTATGFSLLKRAYLNIKGYLFEIQIKNKKDYVYIHDQSERMQDCYQATSGGSERVETYISPEVLPFPYTMGGGASRCAIWDIYEKLGFAYGAAYEMCSTREFLENTAQFKKLLGCCENSNHCGKLIRKLREGQYQALWQSGDGTDDIQIYFREGLYFLSEGKHRVCIAKRFGISQIPIVLHRSISPGSSQSRQNNILGYHYSCKAVMEEFIKLFDRIGLDEVASMELISKPLHDVDIVGFLEEHLNNDILTIAVETNEKHIKANGSANLMSSFEH